MTLPPTENNVKAGELFERNIFSVTLQLRYLQRHWKTYP